MHVLVMLVSFPKPLFPSHSPVLCLTMPGGFALGCVFMVLLEEFSSSFGGEMMFYIAGGFTGLSSLLFLILPKAKDEERKVESTTKSTRNAPSAFTLSCACLGILAVGLEAR